VVSNGTRWLGIGPVRGPRAFEDAPPSDGKQYARQDASWAVCRSSTCSDLQNVLDNGRTAVINSSINLFDRVNGRTTVSATLQDPGNGFCRNIYRSFHCVLWVTMLYREQA
jgi:hypothetical protein